MKNLFLFIAIVISLTAQSQSTTKVQTDSLRIFQVGGLPAELIIENGTRSNTNAFLQNWNNGRTRFAYAIDSAWQDTAGIHFRRGPSTQSFTFPSSVTYSGAAGVSVNSITKEITAPGKVDSSKMRNDSLFYYKAGVEYYGGKTTANTPVWGTLIGTLSDQTDLQAALNAKQNLLPAGTSAQYWAANGSLRNLDSAVKATGDPRYAPLVHTHTASQITNLTNYVRNIFSAGSGLDYNPETGVFSWPGTGVMTTLNGLNAAIQTFAPSGDISISSVGTEHAFTVPFRIDSLKRSNDSVYALKNGVWLFQFKDSAGGAGTETDPTVNTLIKNIPISADASTNKYLNWNGSAYVRKQIDFSEITGTAPAQTLQQVLTSGSTLTTSHTIALGTTLLKIGKDATTSYVSFGSDAINVVAQYDAGGGAVTDNLLKVSGTSGIYMSSNGDLVDRGILTVKNGITLQGSSPIGGDAYIKMLGDSIVVLPYNGLFRIRGLNTGTTSKILYLNEGNGTVTYGDVPAGGSGTVTNFSAGDLSPLFTTSEATTTTTPALSFTLSNAAATTVFGNFTNASAAPSYNAASADGQFLVRRSGALTFGTIQASDVPTLNQNTTGSAGSVSGTNVVTNTNIRQSAGLSVIGRSANTTGNVADITGTDGQVLRVSGTALGFGTIATAGIADDAVTYAKIQNASAGNVILGRVASTSGDFSEISIGASQLFGRGSTGDLTPITLGTNLSMSGTTLNAAGGTGSPGGSDTYVQFNNASAFGGSANFTWDNTNSELRIGGGTDAGNYKVQVTGDTYLNGSLFLNTSSIKGATNVVSFDNTGGDNIVYVKNSTGSRAVVIRTVTNEASIAALFDQVLTLQRGGGKTGVGGVTSPTALLHLAAGTATANTAPLKFNSGTNLTTPEDGAMEYNGTHLYVTIGSTRYQLDQQGGGVADGDKGDITVSASGATWTIDNNAVTQAKMANLSTTSRLIGSSSSAAAVTEISLNASQFSFSGTTINLANSVAISNAFTAGTLKATGGTVQMTKVGSTSANPGDLVLYAHTAGHLRYTDESAGVYDIANLTTAQTFTNKRITKRVGTTASSSTPTPDANSHDVYTITALAATATFGAPTGTPTEGQSLVIRVKDNGTARSLSWNAVYRAGTDVTLPTTTTINKTLYIGFIYNATDSKWDCVAVSDGY